jgi:methionyl-tRNA formyltransferase
MIKVVYAGDREISVKILEFMITKGCLPCALLVPEEKRATHDKELIMLCHNLDKDMILRGSKFREKEGMTLLERLKPDYIIGIHFPYIVPEAVLKIPVEGVLNLHPAYLPFNRGWHTPSWAILGGTPYGATLHFMDEGIDSGDIVQQKEISISPDDTADKLYKKVLELEIELFKEAWPLLATKNYKRHPQKKDSGTVHIKSDLSLMQQIDQDEMIRAGDLIRKLRALTTNNIYEAAYFQKDNKRYRIQINIIEDNYEK